MKFIYRVFCNACADNRFTGKADTPPVICPYCASANIDTNSIAVVDQEVIVENEMHISCGGHNNSSFTINDTTWTIVRKVIFAGTDILGTPVQVKFDAGMSSGTGSVRLKDLTNNITIASKNNITDDGIYKDSNPEGWPSGEAKLAVQAKSDSILNVLSIGECVIVW